MSSLSRREFARLGIGSAALLALPRWGACDERPAVDVQEQILELAKRQEAKRRTEFSAVQTPADLEALQRSLREKFLRLIGGMPRSDGPPKHRHTGTIEADDYTIEKFVYESFPGYFVSAILYKPKNVAGRCPAVISPCGHSPEGKAAKTYQICHVNLVRRGYVVMSYDPVGQGERSQCWDAANHKSRYNLTCGEHAVLGNPLYLLGTSLARYRIWDGIRAIDYLTSRDDVDPERIGCVGNSGGGTLTAYISALDPRVKAAAIGCYITTLPRRMGNRIEADPDADPEQDIADFVSEGIDQAGLVALRAPKPTLLACAQFDFFPIEGARESYDEAKHLYEVAGAGEKVVKVEAAERHGLSLPLRLGVYGFFERWLAEREVNGAIEELSVMPRPASELLACPDGQVSTSFHSLPLLPLAWDQFQKTPQAERKPLRELLRLDPTQAAPRVTKISGDGQTADTVLLLISGNESCDWREQSETLQALAGPNRHVAIVEPRGVGSQRSRRQVKGKDYADPLVGVEENIAYNAFLSGQSLLGIRVADVLAAIQQQLQIGRPRRIVLVGRRDAALVAALAAAADSTTQPGITHVALDGLLPSFQSLFNDHPTPINAASILPNLLKHFGDIPEILAEIKPRPVLTFSGNTFESINDWLK